MGWLELAVEKMDHYIPKICHFRPSLKQQQLIPIALSCLVPSPAHSEPLPVFMIALVLFYHALDVIVFSSHQRERSKTHARFIPLDSD
jgi:hypothetical protein